MLADNVELVGAAVGKTALRWDRVGTGGGLNIVGDVDADGWVDTLIDQDNREGRWVTLDSGPADRGAFAEIDLSILRRSVDRDSRDGGHEGSNDGGLVERHCD